ncbi:hypothetical protein [Streptomyces uncialis]|uniref:hypothetical protein n=1 Tax=Streptomyces uncialis TaxID=1048205 RepID=UPI0037A9CDA1
MSRYYASPTHILALVKGAAEGDAIKHITPAGLGTHLDDAVACGLLTVGSDAYDLHPTDTGRALYEAHLTGLPDGRANHWGSAVPAAAVDQVHQLHLEATGRAVVVEAELTGPGHGTVTVTHGAPRATPPRATLGRTRNTAGRATGWYISPTPDGPAPARVTGRTKDDVIRRYLRTLGIQSDAITYARINYAPPR